MAKRKFLKMGWFGWTLLTTVTVVLVVSALFFMNLFNLGPVALFSDSDNSGTDSEDMSEETVQKVEEVRETVGKENQAIGQFISDTHDFYNETTGYGGMSSLDWENQREKANTILDTLDDQLSAVEDETLKQDLEEIQTLANAVTDREEPNDVRSLHRMFHDLDIGLNDYNTYDKIWHVTETLETTN
ncbi:hypothetical protein [Lentibacillus amyloliquefaciens]|uniref:Uncharacterized protein n=1 Tax=Lentibacillus amyloliquefaciens TaxID=1472767 RepID=A0A0U3NQA7_9BACI|nr:hypothetical protein [Lentibacillus amyloliquefaciens]ALX48907.1 hypothetical protein AOX59_09950 [Lentibacillus amyloliquefaciens]